VKRYEQLYPLILRSGVSRVSKDEATAGPHGSRRHARAWLLTMRFGTAQCYPNRSAAKGLGSANGVSPVIISESRRPLTGPSVKP
jgi:hypothetical protein